MAIEYRGPAAPTVAEGDTLTLTAVALDAGGEPLPDVPVIWHVIELDTVEVGFTLDSLTGLVTGVFPGGWRVRAEADGLRTSLLTVTVVAVPDSIAAVEPARVELPAAASESPPLTAAVFDVRPGGGAVTPLAGQAVRFTVIEPAVGAPGADGVAVAASGQSPGDDPRTATVQTGASGRGIVTARRTAAVSPDSAIIEAVALTKTGAVVPGTPARFIVLFGAN